MLVEQSQYSDLLTGLTVDRVELIDEGYEDASLVLTFRKGSEIVRVYASSPSVYAGAPD